MDINKVTLIGHLVRKPTERPLPSGQKLAQFNVATNYVWRDNRSKEKKDKTEFHTVIAWGKLADIVIAYLDKGSRIYIEGRLQYRTWRDAKEQTHKSTEIIADELIMLSPNGKGRKSSSDDAFAKEGPSEKELVVEEA